MQIARRGLLGLGAAAAVSTLASACRGPAQSSAGTSSPLVRTRRSRGATDPKSPRFFGQPPPGHLYYGASLPYSRSLHAFESSIGSHLALNRSYFTYAPDVTRRMALRCHDDLANGRLPHVSVKPAGTWHDVATGAQDPWLNTLLLALGQQAGPVFLTIHHEPENDAGGPGMLPVDFVAMQRHVMERAAELAPTVTVIPVLQHWTFDPVRDDSDPRAWIVPEAAVFGIDIYNPWSPTNGRQWRTFSSLTDEVLPWAGDTPVAIGEYGCRVDPSNPDLTTEWLRDAADYSREIDVVSMSYFNSHLNTRDGSMALHGQSEQTFASLLKSPWVARPV